MLKSLSGPSLLFLSPTPVPPVGARGFATGTGNRGVMFMGNGVVEVKDIPFPKLELDSTQSPVVTERQRRKCDHGVILKVTTTNICGSDQHMVRGRTSLPGGHMILGHEITGILSSSLGCTSSSHQSKTMSTVRQVHHALPTRTCLRLNQSIAK